MEWMYDSHNVSIKIYGEDDYEKFLLDHNSLVYIDYLKIYNLYNYDIIDLSKFNVYNLELHMGVKPKYILPKKLSQLILSNCNENNSNDILNNLPTNLKYLEIEFNYCFNKTNLYPKLDFLPSSIEILVLPGDYQNNLENLPNSIKKIIFNNITSRCATTTKFIDFTCLSDSIEQLQISNNFDYDKKIIKLPSELDKLLIYKENFGCHQLPVDYYSSFYELNNLTYLKTNIILPYDLIFHMQKLKYLNFWFDTYDLKKLENILSNTLEYLSMKYDISHLKKDIFEYDNMKLGLLGLKNLKLKLTSNKKTSIIFKNLPYSLVSLTIFLNISEYHNNVFKNYSLLEKLQIEQLPESLEFLKIVSYHSELIDENKISINLPLGIKYLIYDKIANHNDVNLPNSLLYLEINSYHKSIQKLSNLEYLKINSNDTILNFEKNINLSHLIIKLSINNITSYELVFNSNLEVLLLDITFNFNEFNESDEFIFFTNFNFSSNLKIFGLEINYEYNCKLSKDDKELLELCLKKIFRTILSNIPDSVEVFGINEFFNKIPMVKFPKSLNKLYMEHRDASLCGSFENIDIYSTIENEIDEYRTEAKRGEDPIGCMCKDYFTSKLIEYKKSNEYWDEYFDS